MPVHAYTHAWKQNLMYNPDWWCSCIFFFLVFLIAYWEYFFLLKEGENAWNPVVLASPVHSITQLPLKKKSWAKIEAYCYSGLDKQDCIYISEANGVIKSQTMQDRITVFSLAIQWIFNSPLKKKKCFMTLVETASISGVCNVSSDSGGSLSNCSRLSIWIFSIIRSYFPVSLPTLSWVSFRQQTG